MDLADEDRAGLEALLRSEGYDRSVPARAQIVLWWADGHSTRGIARMAGTTKPTVYKWVKRYEEEGIDGLTDHTSPGRPREISGKARSRIIALSRQSPPEETGFSHWSSREMASYLKREEGISVSHDFVAELWQEHGLRPWQQGTSRALDRSLL